MATVEFQPDGHTLLVAGRDGAVHTLDTRLESWIDRACDVAGRNLTDDEWAEAIGDRPYHETCPALRRVATEHMPGVAGDGGDAAERVEGSG